MTFKHVKFEDSAVMRSLERMAREKGLVPEPARVKTASAPDLGFPQSSTLMENILRLCAGLRHAGFDKHANEVEEKFLAFKQAQTLYETSSEKGEDLIDRAHPKGSHKLEDVDGDDLAVFETVIDQHLKHLKMIEKMPTGKLANNNQILSAVKIVLGQDAEEEELVPLRNDKAIMQLNGVLSILNKAKSTVLNKMNTTTLAKSFDTNTNEISATVSALSKDTPPNVMIKQINSVMGDLGDIQNSLDFFNWKDAAVFLPFIGPAIFSTYHAGDIGDLLKGDWEGALRDKIAAFVNQAKANCNKARSYIIGEHDLELKKQGPKAEPSAVSTSDPTLQKIQSAFNQYSGLLTLVSSDDDPKFAEKKAQTIAWIKGVLGNINTIKLDYSKLDPESKSAQSADYSRSIDKIMAPFKDVHDDWS